VNPGGESGGAAGGPPESWTFEQLMDALEAITARLASGELGIEAAADLYEQAEHLHSLASERLAQVQARVERLTPPPSPA
jgi:exodeoxyribonuclease VII small subunit